MRLVVSCMGLLILVLLMAFVACDTKRLQSSGGTERGPASGNGIPGEVLEGALGFIASRVGEGFCQRYIVFDQEASKSNPEGPGDFPGLHPHLAVKPSFKLVFWIRIPDKPYVQGRIQLLVDGKGELLPGMRVYGLPDCVDHPGECDFSIDQSVAIDLAQNAGLEEGLAEWETAFTWMFTSLDDPISGTYVWKVSNTMSSTARGVSGKTIVIDANSSEVLDRMGWATEWDY